MDQTGRSRAGFHGETDPVLRAKYVDFCSAQLTEVFLSLSDERIYELVHEAAHAAGTDPGTLGFTAMVRLATQELRKSVRFLSPISRPGAESTGRTRNGSRHSSSGSGKSSWPRTGRRTPATEALGMAKRTNGSGGNGAPRRPQMQMWEDETRETSIGRFENEGVMWDLHVLIEPVTGDLVHGRLSFRAGEERYDTAPLLVEETAEDVVRQATEFPRSMLRQLLISVLG